MKKLLHFDVSEAVDVFVLIKRSTRAIATSGKPYLTLVLQDQSGEMEARLWDATPRDEESFVAEAIVKVAGEIQNYKGKKQLKLKSIRLKAETEPITLDSLLPRAPLSRQDLEDKVNHAILDMTNPNFQRITRFLVRKYEKDFYEYPAAVKNHHEFVSGLAYHVVSMLDMARAMKTVYPTLNFDLIYAGIILHDLGKVLEFSGAVATSYTLEGNLIGHITLVVSEIAKAADELSIESEDILLLQHMVLSHHGKEEWGSPKKPMIREAEVLHHLDDLDAKMNMMDRALEHVKPGEFTERIYAMDGRILYKPKEL